MVYERVTLKEIEGVNQNGFDRFARGKILLFFDLVRGGFCPSFLFVVLAVFNYFPGGDLVSQVNIDHAGIGKCPGLVSLKV